MRTCCCPSICAEKRAAVIAEAHKRHFEGNPEESLPEDVKAYMRARWEEIRLRLDNNEPLGVVKKSELWGRHAE